MLDEELVLQHDHVALALGVLHLLLEASAQAVERGAAGVDLLVGAEQVEPAQTGEDALLLVVVGELGLALDGPVKVLLGVTTGAQDLCGGLSPGDGSLEEVVLLGGEEAEAGQSLDEGRVALVAKGATDRVWASGML